MLIGASGGSLSTFVVRHTRRGREYRNLILGSRRGRLFLAELNGLRIGIGLQQGLLLEYAARRPPSDKRASKRESLF